MRSSALIAPGLTVVLWAAAVSLASFPGRLHAADETVSVEVDAPFEPVSAVGLIINGTTTTQKIEATFKRGRGERLTVSFPVREAETKEGAMATALVIAEDGVMAFGEMKPIGTPDQRAVASDIPDCPPEKLVTTGLEGQLGLLESLLEVRTARRANSQQRLREILTPELVAKLAKLEKGFGLARPSALSANLPPLEVHERSVRISAALKGFREAKRRAEQASEANTAAAPSAAEPATPSPADDETLGLTPEAAAGN
jgi:hypothetical protein